MDDLLKRIHLNCIEEANCWLWAGGHSSNGTPYMRYQGKLHPVRRLVAMAIGKHIGKRMASNICQVKSCVSPTCLRLYTMSELRTHINQVINGGQVDEVRRLAISRGIRKSRAKLTIEQAREIRLDPRSNQTIANAYGIDKKTVWLIKANKAWRDLENPWLQLMAA